jgi:uncharacterized protein (TIGR04222 family)
MAACSAAPVLLVLLARVLATAPSRAPAVVLDAYEVGYLAGGAQRAAEVVIGELSTSGALRVDSAGQISQADPAELAAWSAACPHGIAAGGIPDGLRAAKVRGRLAKEPGIVAIGARLRADRLLIPRSWIIAARVTALALWLALLVAGALRLAEGAHNHRPTVDLQELYLLSVPLGCYVLYLQGRLRAPRTRTGSGYLGQPGLTTADGEAALLAIALAGLVAVEDPVLRAALLAGLPSSGGGSGCGGGGGSGCGGGCGGGGCGG